MAARPKIVEGQYNIECAVCGQELKSGEMVIGKESELPMHARHADENQERFPFVPPLERVPDPQNQPDDLFKSYDVSHTPTVLTYD
jgi:hypothetical protein